MFSPRRPGNMIHPLCHSGRRRRRTSRSANGGTSDRRTRGTRRVALSQPLLSCPASRTRPRSPPDDFHRGSRWRGRLLYACARRRWSSTPWVTTLTSSAACRGSDATTAGTGETSTGTASPSSPAPARWSRGSNHCSWQGIGQSEKGSGVRGSDASIRNAHQAHLGSFPPG
jgi:hypothetical protein